VFILLLYYMKQVSRRFGPVHRAAFRKAAGRKHLGTDDYMPVGRSIPAGEIRWPLLVRDRRETSSIRRGWIKSILWYNNIIIVWTYSVWLNNKPLLFSWSLQHTYLYRIRILSSNTQTRIPLTWGYHNYVWVFNALWILSTAAGTAIRCSSRYRSVSCLFE